MSQNGIKLQRHSQANRAIKDDNIIRWSSKYYQFS